MAGGLGGCRVGESSPEINIDCFPQSLSTLCFGDMTCPWTWDFPVHLGGLD